MRGCQPPPSQSVTQPPGIQSAHRFHPRFFPRRVALRARRVRGRPVHDARLVETVTTRAPLYPQTWVAAVVFLAFDLHAGKGQAANTTH